MIAEILVSAPFAHGTINGMGREVVKRRLGFSPILHALTESKPSERFGAKLCSSENNNHCVHKS